jgi:hypothetical protein
LIHAEKEKKTIMFLFLSFLVVKLVIQRIPVLGLLAEASVVVGVDGTVSEVIRAALTAVRDLRRKGILFAGILDDLLLVLLHQVAAVTLFGEGSRASPASCLEGSFSEGGKDEKSGNDENEKFVSEHFICCFFL